MLGWETLIKPCITSPLKTPSNKGDGMYLLIIKLYIQGPLTQILGLPAVN